MRLPLHKSRLALNVQTLTDGATVSWETSAERSAVVTLGGDRTLAAATGHVAGHTYVLRVVQDGTGGRLLTWNAIYKFHADALPILSAAIAAEDTFVFVSDGTNLHCINAQKRGLAPRGYIDGLIMSHDTDTAHDIALSNGEATMIESTTSETRVLGVLSSSLVKRLDADWADGTTNGGIASGARAAGDTMNVDTWYHYFIIAKTDGTIDAGVDTSTSAANLLSDASDYSFYRRIGSVLSDGSSNVTSFVQNQDWFLWASPAPDVDVTNVGATTIQTATLSVPTGYEMFALIDHEDDGLYISYIHSPNVTDLAPAALTQNLPFATTGYQYVHTDTSAQIKWRAGNNSQDCYIVTLGWLDPRGRAVT